MHESTDRIGLGWVVCLAFSVLGGLNAAWPTAAHCGQPLAVVEGQPQPAGDAPPGARGRRGGRGPAEAQPATPPPQGEAAKPGQPPAEGEKKEGAAGGEKKEEKPADVARTEQPPHEVDPKQLEISLNADGQVPPFNFQGQPWPAVLQWYAKLANCSLDYTEVPNGFLNVSTQRTFALDEVRNLLNPYLLARGYTIVQHDRVVRVTKMENLDPSQVEQVSEIDLYSRKPFDVVKVVLVVPKSMDIAKAKDDLKQVLNPKAKLNVLVTSRQLLAIDTAANLQTLSNMLNEERAKEEGKSPLKQFILKHRRAEEVIDILYVTLGLDPKSKPSQQELQVRAQELQIMQQMAQRGTDVAKMLKPDGPPVFLTFNSQMNSIIANAPSDQMQMIDETIKWLDVPLGGSGSVEPTAVVDNKRTMQTHKLKTLNPTTFKKTLEDIGDLSPFTVLEADQSGRALFVQANAADQAKIAELIKRLDGEERIFKMIQLRRYPADRAAISIRELIAGKSDKEDGNQDPYYRYLMSMSSRNMPKEDPHEGFYVSADSMNNRLLIKANSLELELITNLMRELGEVQYGRKNGVATRVLDSPGSDILEKLRTAWGQTEVNPLVIDAQIKSAPKGDDNSDDPDAEKKKPETTTPAKDRGVELEKPASTATVFAHFASPSGEDEAATLPVTAAPTPAAAPKTDTDSSPTKSADAAAKPPASEAGQQAKDGQPNQTAPPPVSVTITEDGRFVIRSADPDAVDRMEALISELSPAPKRVKLFRLKHQYASAVWYNLQTVFAEELKEDSQTIRDYFGQYQKTAGKENGTGLSKIPKLIIDYDSWINAIVVSNASANQLKEIEDLITEFDKEPPQDKVRGRRTAAVKVNHSKASIIAAALKEVYIDWLTTRDKEFDAGDGKRQSSGFASKVITDMRFGEKSEGAPNKPIRTGLVFNGELSIGVDDVSNNILVFCQEELFDGVVDMIHKLDQESAPPMSIVVQPLGGQFKAADLTKTITDTVGKPWLGGRPEEMQAARGGQAAPPAEGGGQPANPPRGNARGGARGR